MEKKSLKGKIFDNWHTNFNAKMSQARIDNILDENFIRPDPGGGNYSQFKIKLDSLKKHILTATINSNARLFINPKKMDGLQIKHNKDRAVKAATTFENVQFNR